MVFLELEPVCLCRALHILYCSQLVRSKRPILSCCIQKPSLINRVFRKCVDNLVSLVRPIDLPVGSKRLLILVVFQEEICIWNFGQLQQLPVLLAQQKSLLPFFHLNVKVHQALHIAQLQKDFLGIPVLLILLEQGRAAGQHGLTALLVDDPADLNESVHIVLLLVQLDRLLVVFACDVKLA